MWALVWIYFGLYFFPLLFHFGPKLTYLTNHSHHRLLALHWAVFEDSRFISQFSGSLVLLRVFSLLVHFGFLLPEYILSYKCNICWRIRNPNRTSQQELKCHVANLKQELIILQKIFHDSYFNICLAEIWRWLWLLDTRNNDTHLMARILRKPG